MTVEIRLRPLIESDYAVFFEHRRDPVAATMAAFGTRDPDVRSLAARWEAALADRSMVSRTIVEEKSGAPIGFVATFLLEGRTQVTYWIARSHWGRGIASLALAQLLAIATERPIYASAAKDNVGSLRVLQKCGFIVRGSEKAFASARGEEVEEVFLSLE